MANTNKRYSLARYDVLPNWLQRSWNVFARVRIRADYRQDLEKTRDALQSGAAHEANEVIRIQRDHSLGQGMDKLIKLQLTNPSVTDDELLNAIRPPLRFINYGVGEVQPSDSPKEEFAANERLNALFTEKRGIDLSRTKELTHLLIPPSTSKSELLSFIEAHYDAAAPLINAGDLYFASDKNSKQRISRVTEDSIIDERIDELRRAGKPPRAIAPIIKQEFGKELETFEISKRLYQMRRRKNRQ